MAVGGWVGGRAGGLCIHASGCSLLRGNQRCTPDTAPRLSSPAPAVTHIQKLSEEDKALLRRRMETADAVLDKLAKHESAEAPLTFEGACRHGRAFQAEAPGRLAPAQCLCACAVPRCACGAPALRPRCTDLCTAGHPVRTLS